MSNTKSRAVIVGVDTHKSTHVAVAIDIHGARLATLSIPANPKGLPGIGSLVAVTGGRGCVRD